MNFDVSPKEVALQARIGSLGVRATAKGVLGSKTIWGIAPNFKCQLAKSLVNIYSDFSIRCS